VHVCRALSQLSFPNHGVLAPCLHRLIALADPWQWPSPTRADEQHVRLLITETGGRPDGCAVGAACAIEVLLAIRRIACSCPQHIAALLPLMLTSQQGFKWPCLAPLQRVLHLRRHEHDKARGAACSIGVHQAYSVTTGEQTGWEAQCSEAVDLLTCCRDPSLTNDRSSTAGLLEADRSSLFAAVANLVTIMNAAWADSTILLSVPLDWRRVYNHVCASVLVGSWSVAAACPDARLSTVDAHLAAWTS
jgi:hypothetical protein